jgi:membrane-bound lytic murein transglycosylase A
VTAPWRAALAGLAILGQAAMADAAGPRLDPLAFAAIAGWRDDDHAAAFAAFRRSCAEIVEAGRGFSRPSALGGGREDWLAVCTEANGRADARNFFESHFTPLAVVDEERPEGLFTGYYEPEAEGRRTRAPGFDAPLYAVPDDLVTFAPQEIALTGLRYGRRIGGKPMPYHSRAEIEAGALAGRGLEIAWLRDPADAFFMQVQGSGRVRLETGEVLRLAYGSKTGLPYTGIGHLLAERGVIAREALSMQAIRAWMAAHPAEARDLMRENRSFVFFREREAAAEGPPGAQQVPLSAGRSLAVDRRIWAFGTPVWLDTEVPAPHGPEPLRRLLVAQDTGSAILGAARGDVFFGAGPEAAYRAGHMKSPGRMIVLLPNRLARRLLDRP